jgi:hypothetical protein
VDVRPAGGVEQAHDQAQMRATLIGICWFSQVTIVVLS